MSRDLIPATAVDRFWSKVDKSAGLFECWRWISYTDKDGYGLFGSSVTRNNVRAHRVAYELSVGPIPQGLTLDHLCRVRDCVNPTHLEPVTGRVNTLRGMNIPAQNARKTVCGRGHSDWRQDYSRPGNRFCRTCKRTWQRAKRARVRSGRAAA